MCHQILVNLSHIKFDDNTFSTSQVVSCGKTERRTGMAKQTGQFPSTYILHIHKSIETPLEHHIISPKTIFEQRKKVGRPGLSSLPLFNTSTTQRHISKLADSKLDFS
jgi:hypothetical protein